MGVFEEHMYRKRRRQLRCFLSIPVLLALLIGVGLYVFTYHINRFSVAVELLGDEKIVLEYGSSYAEPGAQAHFSGTRLLSEGVSLPVEVTGSVDVSHIGTYEIHYMARHERWESEKIRTVQVVDTVAPKIWLAETPGSYVLPGRQYQEQGFIARDNYDGDLTDSVVKTVLKDRIVYTVSDSSGNRTEAVRMITYFDPLPPELTLLGETSMTVPYGIAYEDPGFKAWDNNDGDLTNKVTVSGTVDSNRVGTYTVTYTVEDLYGNTDTKVRTVRVKSEVLPKPHQSEVIPEGKVIYLTFDDGPSRHTQRLLDVLAKYNVKATFFVVNTEYLHLLDDIVNQGHSIAAHTSSHVYKRIYASEKAYFDDLNSILSVIQHYTGVSTKLIRFPGGSSNTVSRNNPGIMSRLAYEVVNRGYKYFDWNVNSEDTRAADTADEVAEWVINGVQKQRVSIVLQHDIKGFSVDAVEEIIQWGLANGYTFLPLDMDSPTAAHDLNN